MGGQNRPDAVLSLHHTVDDEDRLAVGDLAVAVEDVGFDRHVDLAELVLKGEEANLLRRRWGLARDHEAGDPDSSPVRDGGELIALEGA